MADLSNDDVLQILELIEKSTFDYFQLEMGDLKLTVSKEGDPGILAASSKAAEAPQAASQPATAAAAPSQPALTPRAAAASLPQPPAPDLTSLDGLVPVRAPMVGTFYAQSEPGAPPYVQLGSKVDEDSTLGLIEVMKVFNSIRAGTRGVIAHILAQNGQFVEYEQTLFLIKPDEDVESFAETE